MERNHHNSSSALNNQQETNGSNQIDEPLNDESNGVESEESSVEVSVEEEEEDKEEEEDEDEEEEDEEEEENGEEEVQPKINNHKPGEVVVVQKQINQYNNKLGSTSKEVLEHIEEAIDNVVKHFTVSKSDLLEASTSRPSAGHQNNSSSSATKSANKVVTKRKKKRKSRSNPFNFGLDNDDFPFELGSKKKKKQPDKSATGKRDASGNLIGPFVRVERRKQQINYTVVNSSSKLEDKDNKFSKPNCSSIAKKSSDQVLFKPNDPTWVCVFCKRAPHFKQLGDLYGPHELVNEKANSTSDSTSFSQTNQLPSTSHHHNNNNSLLAINAPPPETTRNEIWFHEDCVIWSNGIYLAGNRVRNIDEIVLECLDIVSLAMLN